MYINNINKHQNGQFLKDKNKLFDVYVMKTSTEKGFVFFCHHDDISFLFN